MIDARTRLVALLGDPVAHSLSPAMHNAGFREAGLNACYLAFPVPAADLARALAGLRAVGFLGANVTVPHKEQALYLADGVDPVARAAGAVNTLAWEDGRLVGYNTDGDGFLASLAEAGFDPRGREALLFGAGGAARGVALALLRAGARRVWLANRTAERAEALVRSLAAALPLVPGLAGAGSALVAVPLGVSAVARVAPGVTLIVNCTSAGMHPAVDEAAWEDFVPFPAGALAVDLVYNPARTRFLALAEGAGLATLGGLGMLVHQAALSWRHWFGRPGPVDVFYRAARAVQSGEAAQSSPAARG